MMRRAFIIAALLASPATAQLAKEVRAPGGFAPMESPCVRQAGGACEPVSMAVPLPTTGRTEAFALATANVAAAPVTLWGGPYVLTQSCSAYGSVSLRYRGPDGATMTVMVTKTSPDASGGTLVSFGSSAVVDAALTGTTGCNVTLARIP